MNRTLLLFVDGVGIGAGDPATNAFVAAPPPFLTSLLDGALIAEHSEPLHTHLASLVPLDAQLDVPGLPQSGTGQFSLLTGQNGALRFGRHYGPWVPTTLRDDLQHVSLLARSQQDGRRTAFANAYPEELLQAASTTGVFRAVGPLRAGPPLAAAGAGLLTRSTADLQRGHAISSEITNETWRIHLGRLDLPVITAQAAGANLAGIANAHDLTLFAHYNTDHAGHLRSLDRAIEAISLLDAFINGVLTQLDTDVTLIVASDHGNLEDTERGHTHNPALGLVVGREHEAVAAGLRTIMDVGRVSG